MSIELERLKEILAFYTKERSELVPILREAQGIYGYLPKEVIYLIGDFLGISPGEVYAVASFYNLFRFLPLGRQVVSVCRGTACHIKGAPAIFDESSKRLGLKEGETSEDLEYTLESVACLGCCALAPCMRVNYRVYGELTRPKVAEIFPQRG